MQRDAGVDLRTGVAVEALKGDADGHVRQAQLSDGTTARRRRGGGVAGVHPQHRMARRRRTGRRLLGRGMRCRVPGLRHQRRGDRQHLRRRRHRAGPARALRVPVHGDRARRCRGTGCPDRGAQHGQPREGAAPAPAAAAVLVRPVRRQHQGCRRVLLRRRDRVHPGLGRGSPLRRRLRQERPHRRGHHLQPRQVAGVLRQAHRTVGAVPASAAGLRRAGELRADVGPLPGSA